FANCLAGNLLVGGFRASQDCGDLRRNFGSKVENDAPLDIALDCDKGGNSLPAIGAFFHGQITNLCRTLQRLREDGVRGVDERLNQIHSHERCSPASATGAPVAEGSSLKT